MIMKIYDHVYDSDITVIILDTSTLNQKKKRYLYEIMSVNINKKEIFFLFKIKIYKNYFLNNFKVNLYHFKVVFDIIIKFFFKIFLFKNISKIFLI